MFCEVVLVNKPLGLTSRQCVNKIVKAYGVKKVGHAGTLDPGATGMLPVFVGSATKFISYIVDQHKKYVVTMRLGQKTDTADFMGEIIATSKVPEFNGGVLDAVFAEFCGVIQQEVPKVSAVRVNGKRLYEYARSKEDVCLPVRSVEIKSIDLIAYTPETITFSVVCGKGTYVRSLVEDIASKLGSYGYVTQLHRSWVSPFSSWQMVDLDDVVAPKGLLCDRLGCYSLTEVFSGFARVDLNAKERQFLLHGKVLQKPLLSASDLVALYCDGEFLGLGKIALGLLSSIRL
jgi:tRNA pseudouridine55 synthase